MKKIFSLLFFLCAFFVHDSIAQLELPFSVKVLNPKPLDAYYFNNSGTVYASTAEVLSQISASVRYRGQTVNVGGVEYWFEGGTADGNLVVKLGGGGAGPYWLTGANTTLSTNVTINGGRVTYTPTATTAGLNVGSISGIPSSTINGDIWYDLTGSRFRVKANGQDLEMITGFVDPNEVAFGQGTGRVQSDDQFSYNPTTDMLTVPNIQSGAGLNLSGATGIFSLSRHSFTTTATSEGLTIGSFAGNPSAPNNGGMWYNSTLQEYMGRINGVNRTFVFTTSAVAGRVPFFQNGSPISGVLDHSSNFTYNSSTNTLGVTVLQVGSITNPAAIAVNQKMNFTVSSTNAGINVGSFAGNPSSLTDGDVWYNSTLNNFGFRLGTTTRFLSSLTSTDAVTNRIPYINSLSGTLTSSGSLSFTSSTLNTLNLSITGTLSANGSTGTAGQVLTSNGAGAASWQSSAAGDMVLASAQTSTGKKTFQSDATNAGLRLGPVTTAPSTLVTGDMWYRSTNNSYHGWVGADVLFPYTTPTTHQPNAIMVFAGSGATNEGLFGCNANFTYEVGEGMTTDYAFLSATPDNDDALTQVLVRDGTTGKIKYRTASSLGGGGSGDVVGPASATDNAIVRYDGTTGKLVQNSGVTITDLGTITAGTIDLNGTSAMSLKTASTSRVSINNTGTITLHDAPSTDNGSTKVLTRDASTQALEMMDIQSGRYTPSVTAGTGGSINASGSWHYTRVGNEVTIAGYVQFSPSGASTTGSIIFSLPIASNFTGISDLIGSGNMGNIDAFQGVNIFSEGTDDTGRINFKSGDGQVVEVRFTAMYEIK